MATMHMEQISQLWALEKLLPPAAGRNKLRYAYGV